MNYDSLKALAAQIFYLRNASEEMTDYGQFAVQWPEELQGLRKLGAGCYGAAYELPDGRVLKLGKIIDGTSLWISEAAKHFAATGKPMRHAPKVWAFDTIEYAEKNARQVFITTEPNLQAAVYAYICGFGYGELPSKWIRVADTTKVGWWAVMEKVQSERDRADLAGESWENIPYGVQGHVLRWADMREAEYGDELEDDMHVGNWGRTIENGRIVVFDPFAGSCTSELRSTYVAPDKVPSAVKKIPPHRLIQHAGPTKGRWARG